MRGREHSTSIDCCVFRGLPMRNVKVFLKDFHTSWQRTLHSNSTDNLTRLAFITLQQFRFEQAFPYTTQGENFLSPLRNKHVEGRVSKCVSCYGDSISGCNFASKIFSIIWSHTGFKILAVLARAQYNHLCLRPNNYDVSSARPIIFAVAVQNICKMSASKAQCTTALWRWCPPKTWL